MGVESVHGLPVGVRPVGNRRRERSFKPGGSPANLDERGGGYPEDLVLGFDGGVQKRLKRSDNKVSN